MSFGCPSLFGGGFPWAQKNNHHWSHDKTQADFVALFFCAFILAATTNTRANNQTEFRGSAAFQLPDNHHIGLVNPANCRGSVGAILPPRQ